MPHFTEELGEGQSGRARSTSIRSESLSRGIDRSAGDLMMRNDDPVGQEPKAIGRRDDASVQA